MAGEEQLRQKLQSMAEKMIGSGASAPRSLALQIDFPARQVSFSIACGEARPDTRAPMASDTPFHIASIAKTMTSVLVLKLAEDGRFGSGGIDTRLTDLRVFEPEIIRRLHAHRGISYGQDITLRHLLTHTSGMKDAMVDDGETTAAEAGGISPGSLIGRIFQDPIARGRMSWVPFDPEQTSKADAGTLNYYLNAGGIAETARWAPGEGFHYSDTGFVILGLLAQHIYQRPMHAVLRDEVFEPCGMKHSYLAYRDDPQLGAARRPEAEVWVDDLACLTSGLDLSFDWGGGGIVSTITDLSAFLQALLAGRLFKSSETIKAMTGWTVPAGLQRPRTGVGLGLFRVDGPQGELWGHSGAWGGKMFHDPRTGLFFAGTANQASAATDWYFPFIGNVVDWLDEGR